MLGYERLSQEDYQQTLEREDDVLPVDETQLAAQGVAGKHLRRGYLLAGGRFLIPDKTGAWLWPSMEDFVAFSLKEQRDAEQRQEALKHLNHTGKPILDQLPNLIGKLMDRLDVDPKDLDGTPASLRALDAALAKVWPREVPFGEVGLPLMAYVGLVLANVTQGKWEVRLSAFDDQIEPVVVDAEGHCYQPLQVVDGALHMRPEDSQEAFLARPDLTNALKREVERHGGDLPLPTQSKTS